MIDNYQKSLFLIYLKEKNNKYDFAEIMSILGMSRFQLDQLISELTLKGLIGYVDYELKITKEGLKFLILQNNFPKDEAVKNMYPHFGKAFNIDDVYVPKNFLKKINIR